jgi:tRNA (guanine-N7-)-methyltransferase
MVKASAGGFNVGWSFVTSPSPFPETLNLSETDFGVPIPGRVLPPDAWARTAIKRLPPPGPLDFAALFGRTAPVVLDLGCGNGRYIISSAVARPECDHLGVDILPLVIRYATKRANQRGLANVRLAVIGGQELLADYIPSASVAEIHIYHPQPYHERADHHRRLVTPEFLALVHRSLAPSGFAVFQTDNRGYAHYFRQVAPSLFDLSEVKGPWPDAPRGRTRREIYARKRGLSVFRTIARPKPNLTHDEIAQIVQSLPRPDFTTRE